MSPQFHHSIAHEKAENNGSPERSLMSEPFARERQRTTFVAPTARLSSATFTQ